MMTASLLWNSGIFFFFGTQKAKNKRIHKYDVNSIYLVTHWTCNQRCYYIKNEKSQPHKVFFFFFFLLFLLSLTFISACRSIDSCWWDLVHARLCLFSPLNERKLYIKRDGKYIYKWRGEGQSAGSEMLEVIPTVFDSLCQRNIMFDC